VTAVQPFSIQLPFSGGSPWRPENNSTAWQTGSTLRSRLHLAAARVSNSSFRSKQRKYPRYFKGVFCSGMWKFESCQVNVGKEAQFAQIAQIVHAFRDGCVSVMNSLQLQKSPPCISGKTQEIHTTFQRASCIREYESSIPPRSASHCGIRPGPPGDPNNGPEIPAFRTRSRLQTPGSLNLRWKSPKVSGLVREYSRFAETIGRRLV
jgi:hypothetical protein